MRLRIFKAAVPVLLLLVFALLTAGVVASAETKETKKPPAAAAAANDMAPETATIDDLKKLYGPVEFTHKAHTGYAGDCTVCHHHSQPGEYFACSQCHSGKQIKTAKDRLPGLKAAYHQQCMNCHKTSGSGPTGCTDCHEKLKRPVPDKKAAQPTTKETPKKTEQ